MEPTFGHLIWAYTGPLYSFPLSSQWPDLLPHYGITLSSIQHDPGPSFHPNMFSQDPESEFC